MTITNTNTVTSALASQLENDASFAAALKTAKVGVSEYVNENLDRVPWCGVYRRSVRSEPRTLGTPPSWLLTYRIAVVVQAVSVTSGEDCETQLENLISLALDAVVSDRTLGGVVTMLNSWDVEYTYQETDRETMYFQTALINLEFEGNVN